MTKLIEAVRQFNDQSIHRNTWLHGDEGSIYVRKGAHVFDQSITPTFDLATIHMTRQGEGHFTNLLTQVEQLITDRPIRIENIQVGRFREFFNKRGYTITGQVGCWCAWRFQ